MKIKIVILILCLAFPYKNIAQKPAKKIRWKAPVALGVTSLLLYNSFAKDAQSTIYRNNFSSFSTNLDDILQYTPTILNVGLSASGLKTKNTRADRLGIFVLGTGNICISIRSHLASEYFDKPPADFVIVNLIMAGRQLNSHSQNASECS